MPSPFLFWTKPEHAIDKIEERIEQDLGHGDDTGPDPALGASLLRTGALVPKTGETGAEAYRANYLYAERKNHWQRGRTWPIYYPTEDIRQRQLAKVQPMFAPVDVIGRACKRQVDALHGREATIVAVPLKPITVPTDDSVSAKERERIAEEKAAQDAEGAAGIAALSIWWDAVNLWEKSRKASHRAAWAGRGGLRARLLPRATTAGRDGTLELVSDLSFAEGLKRMTLLAPLPSDALLYTDPDTEEVACIIRYVVDKQDAAEVWFQEDGTTVRRRLLPNAEPQDLHLPGAELPLQEVTGDLLVTAAVRGEQAQLNYISTKLTRVVETTCDRQMFAADIEEPGDWSSTPPPPGLPVKEAKDIHGNPIYFHPGAFDVGPGLLGLVNGRVIPGTGNVEDQALEPQIVVVDPVDPEYVTKAIDAAEAKVLRECSQGHTVNNARATSGEEKKQDRADFGKRVESYKQSAELAIGGVLTAAGRNALLMTRASDPMQGWFDRFRISVTLHIDTGPLTADEEKVEMDKADRGFKPRRDVMAAAAGVEDFESAEAAISADPVQALRRFDALIETATKIKDGFSAEAAIRFLRDGGPSEAMFAAMEQNDHTTTLTQ